VKSQQHLLTQERWFLDCTTW